MDTVQLRFVGRTLASGEVCLGVRGDSEARKLAFVLPDVAAGQLAYLNVEFSTPTKIPLQCADDGAWVCVLQAPALLESGIFGAQVEIFDGETVVWNSDIFHAVVRDSLSVNEEIEPVMLPELLEAEAALQAAIAKTEDILDAVEQEAARETAEAARVAAEQGRVQAEQGRVTAEQGRVTAESARISAEAGRVQAESGRAAAEIARVAAEQEREQTFEQFEQDIASGKYNGADGLSVELRLSGAYLQWRPTGGAWQNLVALSDITGPAGEDGTDGQSPTITIGVVAKGDTAAATLTGTYPDYVLNLTLPKGDTGSTGATGPTGPKGDDGVSPTISVSKSGKITTITIVDAEGTHTATINDGADGSGAGDMVRATYDANENGIVDDAEKLGGQLPEHYASVDDLAEKASLPVSDTPPEDSEFWVDTGVSPTMMRRWRGADVPTGREYQQTISADTGSASLSIDNAQGQVQSVAVEAGCRARQAGTGDPSPENIRAISGRESVDVRACGKNLYDVNDRKTFSDGVMVDADGWITVTADNSAGSSAISKNCFTNPSLAIRPSTQYAIVCEIAQVNIIDQVMFAIVDSYNDPFMLSQFAQPFYLTLNENTQTGTRIQVLTSRADLSGTGSMLRTYITFDPGASGTVKFRLSVLEDTSITTETFTYESYAAMGGGTVTPTEPLYGLPGAEDTAEVSTGGDVLVTRRTAVVELDGTEYWFSYTYGDQVDDSILVAYTEFADADLGWQTSINSHFKNLNTAWEMNTPWTYSDHQTSHSKYFVVPKSQIADIAAWKSWLAAQKVAGTPVTIVYELAVPTTETSADVGPIIPRPGQVNLFTDADTLTATIYGSGWDTIGDMGGLEAQLAGKVDAADLATVATSGSYNDLTNKPAIPPAVTVDSTITEGGQNPVTGGAIYTALAGKADAGDIPTGLLQSAFHGTVSLLSTGWTQGDDDWYSQTVTATGVTATAIVYVAFHPDSRSAFLDAGIYCSAQAANQLTFKAASQPESNISVNVHAMEVSA